MKRGTEKKRNLNSQETLLPFYSRFQDDDDDDDESNKIRFGYALLMRSAIHSWIFFQNENQQHRLGDTHPRNVHVPG